MYVQGPAVAMVVTKVRPILFSSARSVANGGIILQTFKPHHKVLQIDTSLNLLSLPIRRL